MRLVPRFHPFQGRPPFGRPALGRHIFFSRSRFPSLSGKTSIRTQGCNAQRFGYLPDRFPSLSGKTSIRTILKLFYLAYGPRRFPSLSGKTSIRTGVFCESQGSRRRFGFHPFQGRPPFGQVGAKKVDQLDRKMVSIPFREDLHSDLFSWFHGIAR